MAALPGKPCRKAACVATPRRRHPSRTQFDFGYEISGDNPPWRPLRVYSDGVKTYILFPPNVGSSELPALTEIEDDTSLFGHRQSLQRPQAYAS